VAGHHPGAIADADFSGGHAAAALRTIIADGPNGQYIGGNGYHSIWLNEMSVSVVTRKTDDVARTAYHEMIHFMMNVATPSNVELLDASYASFKPDFIAAVTPLIDDARNRVLAITPTPLSGTRYSVAWLADLAWTIAFHEGIPRVEEGVFLAMRRGASFGPSDLPSLVPYMRTPDYWPIEESQMADVIRERPSDVDTVMTAVRAFQAQFLKLRPAT
jgi:hypothetical protein